MKPVSLDMRAFGPYGGRTVVDFRALTEAGFFLVHGATGAGKTSLLDAICFALYGEASGTKGRTAADLRSQHAAADEPTRVDFEFGLGTKRYRVSRQASYDRPHKRGSGTTTEKPDATLEETDESGASVRVLARGERAVTLEVARVLGLDDAQFRQIVVLPQGDFRQFLLASQSDREKILSTLFATTLFARVQDALKRASHELEVELAKRRTSIAALLEQARFPDIEAVTARHDETLAAQDPARAHTARLRADADAARTRLDAVRRSHERQARLRDARKARDAASVDVETLTTAHSEAARRLADERARDGELRDARSKADRLRDLGNAARALGEADAEVARTATADAQASDEATVAEAAARAAEEALATASAEESRLAALAGAADARRSERETAEQRAKARADLDSARREYEHLKRQHLGAADEEKKAAEAHRLAVVEHERLVALERAGRARELAGHLRDGQPCPVCGSTAHPHPRTEGAEPPAPHDVRKARDEASKLERAHEAAQRATTDLAGRRDEVRGRGTQLRAQLGDALADAPPAELEAALDAARAAEKAAAGAASSLAEVAQRTAAARADVERCAARAAELRAARETAAVAHATASAKRDERGTALPEAFRAPGALEAAIAEAERRAEAMERALAEARDAEAEAARSLAGARVRFEVKGAYAAQEEGHAEGAGEEDALDAAEAALARAEAAWSDARDAEVRLGEDARSLARTREELARHAAERDALDARHAVASGLAAVADGKGRNQKRTPFHRYVLGALLDDVLAQATVRLRALSRERYTFVRPEEAERGGAGLGIAVEDHHTGRHRGAGTLSGGESFLASLALALGLADVVEAYAGGVRLETLFVDEGFGSLDPETLQVAVDALLTLRETGRLVGVISHVDELKERIVARIEVTRGERGSRVTVVA